MREYVELVTRTASSFGIEPLITLTALSDKIFDSTVPLLFDRSRRDAMQCEHGCSGIRPGDGLAQGPGRTPWVSLQRLGVGHLGVAVRQYGKQVALRHRPVDDKDDVLTMSRTQSVSLTPAAEFS